MDNFESTLKEMWATRPPRIPKDQGGNAFLGGVCEGIGARYQIDPTIVRIIFVITTLTFGGGLALYLAMWLVMPRFGMPKSPWDSINANKAALNPTELKERSTGWWLVVGVIFFGMSFTAGSEGGFFFSGLFTAALFFAGWYLLHQRLPNPPEGLLVTDHAEATTVTADFSSLTPAEGYPHPDGGRPSPPSWDPLGTVPELWSLPDPEEPAPTPPKKQGNAWGWVLGVGAIVAALAYGTFGVSTNFSDEGMGDVTYTMSTEESLKDVTHEMGTLTVDFSELPRLDQDHEITVTSDMGEIEIIPPTDVRTVFDCETDLGDENCPPVVNDDIEGKTLTVHVHNSMGEIFVRS
ncbi:PspC domain-containing protein [Corynebacterium breve]|uniref:PspC domain-containing protein n=1 Tax=Corynebacterium breve TaxID=3049799 RepID=A0ABY8VET5_9CORY|nr:PspC domain-containing protein [Corynebacterium breve]WIM68169.1 PspC domain-containing protein [Corynebacterium breve]